MNKSIKDKIKQFFISLFKGKIIFEDYQAFKEYEMEQSFQILTQSNYSTPEKATYLAGFIAGRNSIFKDIDNIIS